MLEEAGILVFLAELSPTIGSSIQKFTSETGWIIDIYEIGYEDEEREYAYAKILAEHPTNEENFFHKTFCWNKVSEDDYYEFVGLL